MKMRQIRYPKIAPGLAAVGALIGLSTLAVAQTNPAGTTSSAKTTLSSADMKFVKAAAQGGIAEVKLGELAAKQGTSDSVKQFGQKMVDDHSKANDELKQVATSKGVTLPSDTDAKSKAIMAKLKKLHGAAFDAAYIKDMKTDHHHDITDFRKEANGGHDPDVKAFASKTLPVIEEHYKMISSMGNMGGTMKAHKTNSKM